MRKSILLIIILFISITKVSATEQFSDFLIIKNDTFFLKTFPLEKLKLKLKVKQSPFKYGDYGFPHTACYRGYLATWKIIDNKLFLVEVQKADTSEEKLDLLNYFKTINYTPTLIEGLILADWYSDTLMRYDFFRFYLNPKYFFLIDDYNKIPSNKIELIFEKGQLMENRIQSIDSYKKGDILWREIEYYRQWFLKPEKTRIEAIVLENNGNMVRVEIKDYGTRKKRVIKKIKTLMKILEGNKDWINPRYWNKKK